MSIDDYTCIGDFAYIPEKALNAYRLLTQTNESFYSTRNQINSQFMKTLSEKDFSKITYKKDNAPCKEIVNADHVYITIDILSKSDGIPLVLVFVPNRNAEKQPWEMQKAITLKDFQSDQYIELGNKPRDMLFNYAYWPNYIDELKKLKTELALPENWSYKETPDDDDFPILKNYISYTFAKLWKDKQVFNSVNGRYSVFNSGLVNRNYQYIYILFEKNLGAKSWKFVMFCCPGNGYGGRILSENFTALPPAARYFSDMSDISYIISYDKTPDEQLPDLQPDHYFIEHPERFPLHFLKDGCRKNDYLLTMLNTNIESYDLDMREKFWKKIGEEISNDPDVYDDLATGFRNAVRKAVMRVSWNYRTAIPVYFPSYNKMSILLPLSFSANSDAEIALVVERNPVSKNYTAPTILSLPMAYSNARLVCKPESDWLNQKALAPVANISSVSSDINDTD